jgi:NAD(P)-dependent dehydrogenase (short-subunit alcohol dehydrogenase family)
MASLPPSPRKEPTSPSPISSEHDDATHTVELIEQEGRRAISLPGISPRRATAECGDRRGRPWAASISWSTTSHSRTRRRLRRTSDEQWRRTFAVNVDSFFHVTKAALAHLPRGASTVNTASINGLRGNRTLIDYSATKGAVIALTYSLAQSLQERGIRVNCVAPGPVWTPLIPATMPSEKVESFGEQVPMGRPAQPDEIAPSDHFDDVAARDLDRAIPILTTDHAVGQLRELGFTEGLALDTWDSVTVEKGEARLVVTAMPAKHSTDDELVLMPVNGSMLDFYRSEDRLFRSTSPATRCCTTGCATSPLVSRHRPRPYPRRGTTLFLTVVTMTGPRLCGPWRSPNPDGHPHPLQRLLGIHVRPRRLQAGRRPVAREDRIPLSLPWRDLQLPAAQLTASSRHNPNALTGGPAFERRDEAFVASEEAQGF